MIKRKTNKLSKKRPTRLLRAKKRHKKTPLAQAKKKLWDLCREITRKRFGNTCYTCQKSPLEGSNWQTGHFITSSVCSVEMRYELDNLRPQCYHCNINLSGNWLAFERNMLRDGMDIEHLKHHNELTKGRTYDLDWFNQKIADYQKLLH